MKKIIKLLSMASMSLSIAFAAEPSNLSLAKQAVSTYAADGEYAQAIGQQINQAEQYLSKRVAENSHATHPKKLAIVLDIDETSLSNLSFMQQKQFNYSLSELEHYIKMSDAPAIKPTLSLYNLAKNDRVAVFFVTGRKQNVMLPTEKNLLAAGYANWDGLFMEPTFSHYASASNFKAPVREKIEKMGYDIVLDVGDQNSDLKGGYADNTVKLPNPFYYIA